MPVFQFVFRAILLCFAVVASGCAMNVPPVPADAQLKDHAILVPLQPHSIVSKIDGKLTGFPSAGTPANVKPGLHNIDVFTVTNGLQGYDTVYIFVAEAGLEYRLKDQNIVEVLDRFHADPSKHGFLHGNANREFVTDDDYARAQRINQLQAENANLAAAKMKELSLPLIRKIGARVCQNQSNGFVYVGYVEAVTDDKVQIRIADAQLAGSSGVRPGGFSPSIVWDSPMRWDLCER